MTEEMRLLVAKVDAVAQAIENAKRELAEALDGFEKRVDQRLRNVENAVEFWMPNTSADKP